MTSTRIKPNVKASLILAALLFVKQDAGVCRGASTAYSTAQSHENGNVYSDRKIPQILELATNQRLSSSVSLLQDPRAKIRDRLKAVHALGGDLSQREIASLYAFLISLPDFREQNLSGLCVVKNDILNILAQQDSTPPDLTQVMVAIYENPAQDYVMRDYSVQHMATWYERGASGEMGAQEQIRALLENAARENTSIAGTALLGLHRLFAAGASNESKKINGYALRMISSSDTDPEARIAGVQVCSERRIIGALPVIEALARSEETTALRISAIAALGRLGGREQMALLRQLDTKQHRAIRPAIANALKQLELTGASRGSF